MRSADRFRWILWRVVAGGAAAHVVFALAFALLGEPLAAWATAAGTVMPLLAAILLRRGSADAAFAASCIDMAVSAVAGTVIAGEASGFLFYLMIPLVLAALYPARSTLSRWGWVAALGSMYIAFELLWPHGFGLAAWPAESVHVLHVVNVLIVSGGMVATALLSAFAVTRAEGKLVAALEHMEALALRDALTGLPNRRATEEALRREASRSERSGAAYSLVMVDVDCFKNVNDTHGHAFGDEVLRTVAVTLRGCLRDQDLVGRWGGEEFLAVLPETPSELATGVAEKLRRAVARQVIAYDGKETQVTITLGVACSSGTAAADATVERADVAMYRGKQAGRDRVEVAAPALTPAGVA